MKTISIFIAAVSGLTATAAFANTSDTAVSTTAAAAPSKANSEQRVCFVDTVTGSRIPTKKCRTRAEWARQGVDLSQLDKK